MGKVIFESKGDAITALFQKDEHGHTSMGWNEEGQYVWLRVRNPSEVMLPCFRYNEEPGQKGSGGKNPLGNMQQEGMK